MWWKRRPARRRVVVIGLDCAEPSLVFERFAAELPTFAALRREGAWGRLQSVVPPITVPAWACAVTGQTPGDLGIYGFRNRTGYGYDALAIVTSHDVRAPTVWDRLSRAGRPSVVIGVPPSYPPRPLHGCLISCFLTPGTQSPFTHPPELAEEIRRKFGEYQFDVKNFRTEDKAGLLDRVFALTEQRFRVARQLLGKPWEFFMVVDMGPDRLHHGFWRYFDPAHRLHVPGNPFADAARSYYRFLDEQLGKFLEKVPDDAAVFVVSDHGAQRMEGGICLNEWLLREGYLKLRRPPQGVRRLEELEVDWPRTAAWGEGGYYGRVFLNVRGREPQGAVPPAEAEALREELGAKLEALGDEAGRPLGTRVYAPEALYPQVNRIAPDLIVLFGGLRWRSLGSLGHGTVWVHENDTGPDDANHAPYGVFLASNVPGLRGELRGLQLGQLAPTALELLGLPAAGTRWSPLPR